MKKRRKYRISSLISLYVCFIFQKSTFIIFILSLLLMTVGICLISNPWLQDIEYIEAAEDFHLLYIQQSLLIIQIFNSVIITTLCLCLGIQAKSFDTLFISHISRKWLCLIKVVVLAGIGFLICFYEMLLVIGVGFIRYPRFIPSLTCFYEFGHLYLCFLFENLLGMTLTAILSIFFVPMTILFLSLGLRVIVNNFPIAGEKISAFFPILRFHQKDMSYLLDYPLLAVAWIILLFFLYTCIYEIKDIK